VGAKPAGFTGYLFISGYLDNFFIKFIYLLVSKPSALVRYFIWLYAYVAKKQGDVNSWVIGFQKLQEGIKQP
jgi:hypothetical protein